MDTPYQPPQSQEAQPTSNTGAHQPSLGDNAGIRMLIPVGRSGWAIAAGYLGLLSLILLPAPLALILSLVAIADINKSKKQGKPKHGMGRAIFGLIAGTVGSVFLVLMILDGV